MSPVSEHPTAPSELSRETTQERRRRLDEVFGDVLPPSSSDDRPPADRPDRADDWADDWADDRVDDWADSNDSWLREQVPPHHGS